jgi:hypothetical protein
MDLRALIVLAALAAASPGAARAYSLTGADPLGTGERALRLSGGLAAVLPQGAAGVPLLGGSLVPVLPRGSIGVGFGAGFLDGFVVYETLAGWVHAAGGELRLRLAGGARASAALLVRLDYEMRGLKVETISFAGALRLGGEARGEVRLGGASLIFGAGVTAELVESEHVGGEGITDASPLLSTVDLVLGAEWPWGKDARFFVRTIARFAADASIQLDRTILAIEVGGGFPF